MTDTIQAINAPVGTNWQQCTSTNVFGGPKDNQSLSDQSLAPAQNNVLTRVIEHTNNTIIGVGNLDFLLVCPLSQPVPHVRTDIQFHRRQMEP